MGQKDPRVDAYIDRSQEFAKPILSHIRELVHKGCPEVEETIKWGFLHFDYQGIMCSMASFKNHCAFGFWKASLMKDPHKLMSEVGETAMGQFGKIVDLSDLPKDKILIEYVREAARLNGEGIKLPAKPKKEKQELVIPSYFSAALKKNKGARETFENFSYSNKKDYVEWLTDARNEETRNKRLETAIEWLAEGKVRNWKYIRK